jgi:hypothetical protein
MAPLESLITQDLGLMIIIIVVFAALVIIIWYLDTHSNNPVFCIDEKDEHEYAISNSAESIYNVLMNREQVTFVNRPRFFSYLVKNMEFHIGSHVIKMVSRNEYEDELGNHWSLHKDYYSKWWVAQHKKNKQKNEDANPYLHSMSACRPAVPYHGFRGGEDNY